MRVFEQEFEKGGNKRKRVLFAVGFEDIEILCSILDEACSSFPKTLHKETWHRMKEMKKAMSVYLGQSQPRRSKSSDFTCPYCPRMLRGELAVEMHVKAVHSKEKHEEND